MKIIICGAGDVGSNIAKYLFEEQHQVTLIDIDKDKLDIIGRELDIQTVCGPSSSPEILEEAGAKDADLIVAVTKSDEVNMLVCLEAFRLFNIPLKIARVRSGFYSNQSYASLFEDMHIDVVISPEKELARTIVRNLKMPGVLEFILMQGNSVFLGAKCIQGSRLENFSISKLEDSFSNYHICISAIIRDGQRLNITSNTNLKKDDEIYLITDTTHQEEVLEALGHHTNKEDRILVIGGGRVGYSLAKLLELEGMAGHTSLIESKENRAIYLAKHLSEVLVLKGDAMDESILNEAGIDNVDAVVSLTGEDEDNILLSLLTKQYGVKRTFALINKTIYNSMLSHLGVDVIVNSNAVATSKILQYIRKGQVQAIYALKAEIGDLMAFEALETSKIVGVPFSKIKIPNGVKICGVVRNGSIQKLSRDFKILGGDSVIILAAPSQFKQVEKLFSAGLFFF